MGAVEALDADHRLPRRFAMREEAAEYVVELDVSDFTREQLSVDAVGHRVTVRGDRATRDDSERLPRHEALEEWFRLPDDAEAEDVSAVYVDGTLEVHARRRPVARIPVPVQRTRYATGVPQGC